MQLATASKDGSGNLISPPGFTAPADYQDDEDDEEGDDDDGDSEDGKGKKKGKRGRSEAKGERDMKTGRRKIRIEFIEDDARRHITFSKRKAGIMKRLSSLPPSQERKSCCWLYLRPVSSTLSRHEASSAGHPGEGRNSFRRASTRRIRVAVARADRRTSPARKAVTEMTACRLPNRRLVPTSEPTRTGSVPAPRPPARLRASPEELLLPPLLQVKMTVPLDRNSARPKRGRGRPRKNNGSALQAPVSAADASHPMPPPPALHHSFSEDAVHQHQQHQQQQQQPQYTHHSICRLPQLCSRRLLRRCIRFDRQPRSQLWPTDGSCCRC